MHWFCRERCTHQGQDAHHEPTVLKDRPPLRVESYQNRHWETANTDDAGGERANEWEKCGDMFVSGVLEHDIGVVILQDSVSVWYPAREEDGLRDPPSDVRKQFDQLNDQTTSSTK